MFLTASVNACILVSMNNNADNEIEIPAMLAELEKNFSQNRNRHYNETYTQVDFIMSGRFNTP